MVMLNGAARSGMAFETPDEDIRELEMRKRRERDELSQFDKDIIGNTCRIEIPFRDVYKMRVAADLLRGYADKLDNFSRRTDLPTRAILFYLREEAKAINRRLKEAKGPGRPVKAWDPEN